MEIEDGDWSGGNVDCHGGSLKRKLDAESNSNVSEGELGHGLAKGIEDESKEDTKRARKESVVLEEGEMMEVSEVKKEIEQHDEHGGMSMMPADAEMMRKEIQNIYEAYSVLNDYAETRRKQKLKGLEGDSLSGKVTEESAINAYKKLLETVHGSPAAEYLGISLIPRFCSLFPILLEDSLYAFDSIISKQINLDKLSGKALYFVQRSIDGLKHLLENVEKMAAKKEILVRLCRTAMKYAFLIPSIAAHNAVEDMIEVSVAKDIDSNNGNRSSFSHIGRIDSGLCFLKMKDDIPIHKVIDINIYKDVVQKCFELYPIESLRSVVDLVKENDLYSCQTIIKGALQLLKACLLMDYRPTTTEDKIKAENRDMQTEEGANRKDKLEETFLVHHLKTLFKSDRISAGKMLRELILMSDTLEIKDISTESKDSVMEIKAALRSSINALGVRKYVDDISDNYKATKPAMDESSTINNIERARSSRSVERREMPLSCVSGATPRGYHERSTTPSSRRDYYRSPRNEYVNGTREHSRNDLSADMRDRSMEPSEEGEIDVPGESSHEISSRTIRNFATVGAKEIRYRPLSRERRRRSLSRELSPRHSDRKYDQRGSSRIPLGATKALWVGGLRDRVDIQSELLDKFCSFGPVASHRFIERSGTAFINFIYIEDAVEARQKMDGSFVSGVQIRVEFKGENLPKGRRESRY